MPTALGTLDFLNTIDHPNLYLLLDVGHLQISNEDPVDVIERAGDHLGYVQSDVIAMVDQLGARLIDRVREKEAEFNGGTGYLRVRFMMTRAEMTERPVYHHICRLFVNGKGRGPSPVVQKAEEWVTLFSQELRAGKHDVEVIHGFVKEKNWDGEFAKQPKIFTVTIEPGETSTLQYSFGVGWFRDAYYYKHPWRGAPK